MAKRIEAEHSSRPGCRVAIVNPYDRYVWPRRWLLSFGTYADRYVLVWADSLESALECAAEWLHEHAPGTFVDPEPCGECGGTDGEDRETCATCQGSGIDETDLTYTEYGYLISHEWFGREVSRRDVLSALGRPFSCKHASDTSAGHPSDCATDRDLALACAQREERQIRKAERRRVRWQRNAVRRANQRAMRVDGKARMWARSLG